MNTERKIAILVGDGMADLPVKEIGNKTPLEAANTPNMDSMAGRGILGMAKTVPEGMAPGSDTANLSIFGYDPQKYYSGRSPLEALNMGLELGARDVSFRCNLVNIDDKNIMADFSAGHIETAFSKIVVEEFRKNIAIEGIEFYPGVSYRNILLWRNYPYEEITETTPPHDIQGRAVDDYLPRGSGSLMLNKIMEISREIIAGSQKIKESASKLKGIPSSAWLWGGGRKPRLEPLKERFGLWGYTISAVDLIHGIGRAAGLSPIAVEGATGYLDTNYTGKADALLEAMENVNFVFLHVESPDESGHEGSLENKIKAIEDFDRLVVGRAMDGLSKYDDYTVLVMPDHPTPVSLKTHTSEPVPFCIYGSKPISGIGAPSRNISGYNERSASATGIFVKEAHRLLEIMVNGKIEAGSM